MHNHERDLENTKHLHSEEEIHSQNNFADNKKQVFEIYRISKTFPKHSLIEKTSSHTENIINFYNREPS